MSGGCLRFLPSTVPPKHQETDPVVLPLRFFFEKPDDFQVPVQAPAAVPQTGIIEHMPSEMRLGNQKNMDCLSTRLLARG